MWLTGWHVAVQLANTGSHRCTDIAASYGSHVTNWLAILILLSILRKQFLENTSS